MRHADQLIERILYLEGVPNVQRLNRIRIGEDVREVMTCDMALELEAIPRLNKTIAVCGDAGDNGSRALLEEILVSEEEHVDWLETQLGLVAKLGVENYQQSQV